MHVVRAVATTEEAEAVLEYFNGFHDGFIKQLTLTSYDYFEERGTQVCSGRLDLELVIAHYNYRSGEPPADQAIHARFDELLDGVETSCSSPPASTPGCAGPSWRP